MHDYSQRLGDAVKRARESQGLTQTELAEKISVAPRTILNIENYKGNPKLEIFALGHSSATDRSLRYLLSRKRSLIRQQTTIGAPTIRLYRC
jgi:DNA-binding XRE family transcriptional regulator